jgi:hypothetical protein
MLTDKSNKIGNAFHKFVDTGDSSHIAQFSKKDIEDALIQFGADKGSPFYIAMERRIKELRISENREQSKQDKWKDRLYGFAFGLLTGLILYLIKYLIEKK